MVRGNMIYMGFYGPLPGIQKYFVAAKISYLRDFVIAGFDCIAIKLNSFYLPHIVSGVNFACLNVLWKQFA